MKLRNLLFLSYLAIVLPILILVVNTERKDEQFYRKVEAAKNFYIKNLELELAISDFFSATRDFLLLTSGGEAQVYRSHWMEKQLKINGPLESVSGFDLFGDERLLANADIKQQKALAEYQIEQIGNNLKLGREAAENIISDHNLKVLYLDDTAKRAELEKKISINLRVLDEVHDKIFASLKSLNDISLSNIEYIGNLNEKERNNLIWGYVLLIFILLAILLSVSYSISSPIKRLVRTFRMNTDFNRIKTGSMINEISSLKVAYNDLMGALESSTISAANLESVVRQKTDELEKKNLELEKTLEDFYMMRLTMQRQMSDGTVESENKKMKKKIDGLKKAVGSS